MPVLLLHYSFNLQQVGVTYTSTSLTWWQHTPPLAWQKGREEFHTRQSGATEHSATECSSERQLGKEHHDLGRKGLATTIVHTDCTQDSVPHYFGNDFNPLFAFISD